MNRCAEFVPPTEYRQGHQSIRRAGTVAQFDTGRAVVSGRYWSLAADDTPMTFIAVYHTAKRPAGTAVKTYIVYQLPHYAEQPGVPVGVAVPVTPDTPGADHCPDRE